VRKYELETELRVSRARKVRLCPFLRRYPVLRLE
jgi:hypothetical protein